MANPGSKALIDELMSMKKRMESLYAESVGKTPVGCSDDGGDAVWQPLVDVYETDDAWLALVDLPGVLEEDLEVKVEHSRLVIEGRRTGIRQRADDDSAIRRERPQGKFRCDLVLGEDLQVDQVKAELNRGVLTVEIARKIQTARKIMVRHD